MILLNSGHLLHIRSMLTTYNTWLGSQKDLNVGGNFEESQKGAFDFVCSHPWDE